MLSITRKVGESFILRDRSSRSVFATVYVCRGSGGDRLRIAVEAPQSTEILRTELLRPHQEERDGDKD